MRRSAGLGTYSVLVFCLTIFTLSLDESLRHHFLETLQSGQGASPDHRLTSDMKLTRNQIDRFLRDGFIGPIAAFSSEEIGRLAATIPQILNGEQPSHHRHLDNHNVYTMCTASGIIGAVHSVLGDDLMIWSSNFFVKQSGARGTPWHQDQNNGVPPAVEPPLTVSIWMALDNVNAANSCLKFITGSHLKIVNHSAPAAGDYFGHADTSSFDLSKAICMELKSGECVMFTDRVLHSAEPNESPFRRAGLTVRFAPPFVKILRNLNAIVVSGNDRFGFNQTQEPPKEA